ncbi:putative dehydrogenase [Bradyrhizobium elkanii]|uniref:NAD(P)-dependent oxidoreductase n=2 Tax=Bradyrhizobium elkanii TaxID=29448 RepID=UPI00216897CF|nr:NAD(P)-dependent oxidoreductase [Bradyrhizobium elkanii]MCP1974833.1 3-hydroxyisobutyrate dehydrogenase-like beta-hydroxyacid dehydrogenase [Bradyrhizobium elkanii]MDH6687816.1 putative dehydrogenase [Bradyrhizobium elkanii]
MARETPVGMIGLGLMGSALSARLIDAGIGVIGFDIDAAKTDGLRASGAEFAAFAADVATRCRTIVIAVYDAAQVRTLLPDLANATPPPRVICATTCAPGEIVAIAEFASRSRLAFIEAPISGTSAEVRAGTATALVAGDADAIDATAATLDILCPQRINVGAIGNASRTKLAINLILQNNRAALAEGIAFAESLGLDGAAFLATARRSAAYSKVMDSKGPKMLARDFSPQSHIAQTLKDAELILQEAGRHGLPLPLTSVQAGLLRAAIALQGPDNDSAAVIEAIRAGRGHGEGQS